MRGCGCVLVLLLTGCAPRDIAPELSRDVGRGQYDRPRAHLEARVGQLGSPGRATQPRNAILDRLRLGVVALADGDPALARQSLSEAFELLVVHNINRGKQLAGALVNEDVKVWKGEPFEQAMAFHYTAMTYAIEGSWDNSRAGILNALYHLQDFDPLRGRIDAHALARRAAAMERGEMGVRSREDSDGGYAAIKTDFPLGYLVNGIANQQMARGVGGAARAQEAADNFAEALSRDPSLAPLIEALRRDEYNTLIVADFGLGPEKVLAGPDGAIARFVPRTPSDTAHLIINQDDGATTWPVACDLNAMARDHRWNGLEAQRLLKSQLGTGMILGGAVAASTGAEKAQWAGLGLILAGALLKAGAHADARYCDVYPQRVYLAPLRIDSPSSLHIQVAGRPGSRIMLSDVLPPAGPASQVIYLRLTDQRRAVISQSFSHDILHQRGAP